MEWLIREMKQADAETVFSMMQVFYASPAVLSNGSKEIFEADIKNCVGDSPYLEGYIFEKPEGVMQKSSVSEGVMSGSVVPEGGEGHDKTAGYAMIAKSFSTEFGKPCIWIEDLYIRPDYRGMGIGGAFLAYIGQKYPEHVFRLEAEMENENAIALYKKCGYEVLPYVELKKEV